MSKDISSMTPKERVFGTLRNLLSYVQSDKDLNEMKPILERALDRNISWESELVNKDEMTKEVDHWRSNHADMVQRNAELRDRPDLCATIVERNQLMKQMLKIVHDTGWLDEEEEGTPS